MDMKSISQKLQDDIRAIMEAGLHPNQQKIDVHEPEKDKITAHDFKKLRAMKKTPAGKVHNCATHVEHAVLGKGTTVSEQHAEPDAEGNIEWYTVQFENSIQKVLTKDLTITMSEAHMHESSEEQFDEEEKKKVVSPFDYKNYKSEIPKKPGELTGHDSKKISTGTVYTKKPVKEESHQSATTMKHIPNASPALKKAAKDIKPGIAGYRDRVAMLKAGGVKEEVEQGIAEADELRARGGLAAINKKPRPGQTDLRNIPAGNYPNSKNKFTDKDREEHPANLKAKIKATLGKHTRPNLPKGGVKEEVELDEGSGPKEKQKTPFRNINGPEYKAAADKQRQQMAKDKAAEPGKKMLDKKGMAEGSFSGNDKMAKAAHDSGDSKAIVRMRDAKGTYTATMVRKQGEKDHKEISRVYDKKDVAEGLPNEYTFADYLEAARAQYVDEDAVLVANEAFKNQDITLFSDQSQSSEA